MEKKIQIGEIVERSKKLEAMLKSLGAEGRGMHELISSIQDKLTAELNKKLRYIATIRNNAIHDIEFDIADNIESFNSACNEAEQGLKSIIKPKRRRASKKSPVRPDPEFNYLFLLPFIPGLNVIYFFFILVLSMLCSSKYIIMIALYIFSTSEIIHGIIKNNTIRISLGSGIFAVLYIFGMFIPAERSTRLRYIPILNIGTLFANIKGGMQWNLFFIANSFILLTIFSGISVFIWQKYLLGTGLFVMAYLGGIIFFLYAGKSRNIT